MNTINDVLKQLDSIIQNCVKANSRQAYFAILYRQMTAAVQRGIQQNMFEDGPRMEKLDVLFASRYVDAWKNYQVRQPLTKSWKFAFDKTAQQYTVIQHLILGINTHINLDLSIAAAATAPGEQIFDLQNDFEKINDVIGELSAGIQQKLAAIWWPMKWLGKITNGSEQAVLNFSIGKARQAAWANSVALAMASQPQQAGHIALLDDTVLALAGKIASPGMFTDMMLKPVRMMERKNVQEIAAILSE